MLHSTTILTGPALLDIAHIHDRRPLTIPTANWEAWLDPDVTDPDEVRSLLETDPGWSARPVSTRVNSVRNNTASADLITTVED